MRARDLHRCSRSIVKRMGEQLTLDLQPPRLSAPGVSEPWVERWENNALRYCDVPKEHHAAWLNETGAWLFAGRRWPMSPTENMARHCRHWAVRVEMVMRAHGWRISWRAQELHGAEGYVVTWTKGDRSLDQWAPYAPYAAICGAAICRRKARYYGLWND